MPSSIRHPVLLLVLISQATLGANWRPNEDFLGALRYVESHNGKFVYGDAGQSLGDFQITEAAWTDVNAWRRTHNLPTYGYERHVFDRRVNRLYAADYISILYGELTKKLNRAPTCGELYAAYNMGLSQFARCQYRLTRVNPVTRRKCQQIVRIMEMKAQAQATSSMAGGRI